MASSELLCSRCRQPLAAQEPSAQFLCANCRADPDVPPTVHPDMVTTPEIKQTVAPSTNSVDGPLPPLSPYPGVDKDYEILDVLGRGGMGVVYRARQVKLNRIVALKMILGGDSAGTAQRERFLAEALAVAKLQHPNIVQIHEIGEHDGLPFVALEFVDGGTLAKQWGGRPQPPGEVAALVETLALAMHEAHQRGIIHRDLKPANVLLTNAGQHPSGASKPTDSRPPLAMPKVTDFGLAKVLDEGGGATRSGDVMGTPCYMAPEQARGQSRDVSPATDVYALGAILYEGLTGHPPFRGDSAMAVLAQVVSADPPALGRQTPRDLETICLKCLEKEPTRRYVSAADLAEDLRRFRADEPITARRASWLERARKWVKRRPARAALAVMSVLVLALVLGVVLARRQAEDAQGQAELRRLQHALEEGLNVADWNRAHVEYLNGLADGLGSEARQRVQERLAGVIRSAIDGRQRPVLHDADVAPIEELIRLLETTDAETAASLRERLLRRREGPQLVLDFKAPFADAGNLSPVPKFDVNEHGVSLSKVGRSSAPTYLFPVACTRNADMEAVFYHPDWDIAEPVGLILNGDAKAGYQFLLEPAAPLDEERAAGQPAPTFAQAMKERGTIRLRIRRQQQVLREEHLPLARVWVKNTDTQLRLRARRVREKLVVRVNDLHTVEFEDPLSLGTRNGGSFGVQLPPSVRLVRAQAWVQKLPSESSPLERGDELHHLARFAEARTEYLAQARATSDPKVRREALYKEALCLLEEKEFDRAEEVLTDVTRDGEDDRWQKLALAQLWGVYLRRGKDREADTLFRNLQAAFPPGTIGLYLPANLHYDIFNQVTVYHRINRVNFLDIPQLVPRLERALEIEQFLKAPRDQQHLSRFHLFRALVRSGQRERARQLGAALWQEAFLPTARSADWWYHFAAEYCLLLRHSGKTREALSELDRRLSPPTRTVTDLPYPLLTERAWVRVALGQGKDARKDLDEFFRRFQPNQVSPGCWAHACLMRGLFLREDGDETAAQAAWRAGLPRSHPSLVWELDRYNPIGSVQQVLLLALTNQLTDAEIGTAMDEVLDRLPGLTTGSRLGPALRLALPELRPTILGPALRSCWKTAEGQALVRHIAFREKPFAELYRTTLVLGFTEVLTQMLQPHVLSKEAAALLREQAEAGYTSATTGKIGPKSLLQLSQLGSLWHNQPALLSWDGAMRALDPSFRAPMAYFFGLRYLHVFKKPDQAGVYFQKALTAPPTSTTHRLAKAELERLKKR